MTPLRSTFTRQFETRLLDLGNSLLGYTSSRIYNSKHMPAFSTIGSSTTGDHCTFPLMSLNPLAPAFLPHYQFPSDPPISLCNYHDKSPPCSNTLGTASVDRTISCSSHHTTYQRRQLHPPLYPVEEPIQARCRRFSTPSWIFNSFALISSTSGASNVYRRFTRPFNNPTNTWRQNHSTGGKYKFLSFNFRMTLLFCATCFFLRLEHLPLRIFLLITPLSVQLRLTLTLLQMHSQFPTLMNHQFVVLTWRMLLDHPERKQPILQLSVFSLHPTHGRPLLLGCKISNQEFLNSKNYSLIKEQSIHLSLPGFTRSASSYMINSASLKLVFRMLSFGRFPLKFVFDSAKVARPSSGPLLEPARGFRSPIFRTHSHGNNFIKFYPDGIGPAADMCGSILFKVFPGDYDNLLQWPFSKLIHIRIRDQLDPLNTWKKTNRPDQDPAYKKPTISTKTSFNHHQWLYSSL